MKSIPSKFTASTAISLQTNVGPLRDEESFALTGTTGAGDRLANTHSRLASESQCRGEGPSPGPRGNVTEAFSQGSKSEEAPPACR